MSRLPIFVFLAALAAVLGILAAAVSGVRRGLPRQRSRGSGPTPTPAITAPFYIQIADAPADPGEDGTVILQFDDDSTTLEGIIGDSNVVPDSGGFLLLQPGASYRVLAGTNAAFRMVSITRGHRIETMTGGEYTFTGPTLSAAFGGPAPWRPSALQRLSFPPGFRTTPIDTDFMFRFAPNFDITPSGGASAPTFPADFIGGGNMDSMFIASGITLAPGSFPPGFGSTSLVMANIFGDCANIITLQAGALPANFAAAATNMSSMFRGCGNLIIGAGSFPEGFGGAAEDMTAFLYTCANVTIEKEWFPEGFGTVCTSYESFFSGCQNLESVTLPAIFNAPGCIVAGFFSECAKLKLTTASLPIGFGSSTGYMPSVFLGCTALELSADFLPAGFGGSTQNMSMLFNGCSNLVLAPGVLPPDFGSSCLAMDEMFANCAFTTIAAGVLPDGFGSAVVSMNNMFSGCSALESIVFPAGFGRLVIFDVNEIYANEAFLDCTSLTSIAPGAHDTPALFYLTNATNGLPPGPGAGQRGGVKIVYAGPVPAFDAPPWTVYETEGYPAVTEF